MAKSKNFSFDDPNHTFIIAEAGSNWKVGTYNEDLEQCKKLIEVAKKSGADAIKFQTFRSELVYVPNAGNLSYLENNESKKSINAIFSNLAMPYDMIPKLHQMCKEKDIIFMSTPFSVQDVVQLEPYVPIFKIASYEINHIKLLEAVSKTKKPVILSTGASTLDEIDFAVKILQENEGGPISILQCTSKYPAPLSSLNLSVIPKLKEKYKIPVGLSDHSIENVIAPLIAIGMGASIIEKHFTTNKTLPGPDHIFALNPKELEIMIKTIREAESSKGDGEKVVQKIEEELMRFAKRAVQATKNINKDDLFQLGINVDFLRPGNLPRGAEPRFISDIIGKRSKRNIKIGEGINTIDCY